MNRSFFSLCLLAATVAVAAPAVAQQEVGHSPESSPFRDVEDPRSLSFYGGYLHTAATPGNIQPQSGPLAGIRWDIHLGGPAYFETRFAHLFSQHDVVNPLLPPVSRDLGQKNVGLNFVDVGVVLSLVGERTWHHVMPVVNANFGVATDLGAARDSGGFRFGTQLLMSAGAGLRFIPGGPLQARLDFVDYFYAVHYPSTFRSTDGGTPVVASTQALTAWRQNLGVTFGLSLTAFR